MREVKPASELRDRVPCPLPRHPAAPCPSFYPNYGARSLAPDFWGGRHEFVRIWALYTTALVAIK